MDDKTFAITTSTPVPAAPQSNSHTGPSGNIRPRQLVRFGPGMILLVILGGVLVGPYLVGQAVYRIRYNELKAAADVATGTLAELAPRLSDLELASRLVAQRVEPSVVNIFLPGRRGRAGQGSGVIVDEDGYVVTNYHVVAQAEGIRVQLGDGRATAASVIGADEMTDLAVLKIDLPNLIAAEWGDSDELHVGDLVWALGSPFGLDRSLTFGIVSAKSRRSGSRLTHSAYQEYLQTDAAVNPGNSGGPLVNIKGEVIGINSAIIGPSYQGVSFAIPSNLAREKYEELRTRGWIDRAWLGIVPREVPQRARDLLGLALGEGVYVGGIQPDAPADRAGIDQGDIILKWNDHMATDPTLLSREIAATEIGSTAKVLVARGQERFEVDVRVERAPWAVEPSGR